MASGARPKVVIDTNVLFEGITRQGGASGYLIEAWLAELLDVRVSNALAYEYADVLSRKLSEKRWKALQPVVRIAACASGRGRRNCHVLASRMRMAWGFAVARPSHRSACDRRRCYD